MKLLLGTLLMLVSPLALATGVISINGLLSLVLTFIVVGLIFWLVWWLLGVAGIPEPFNKVIRVVIAVIAVIVVINLLLGLIGQPFFRLG